MKRLGTLLGWAASLVACDKGETTQHQQTEAPAAVPQRLHITQAEYGDRWPFTVPEGYIECVNEVALVFVVGDERYALNGLASNVAKPIRPIWKDLEPGSPMKVNLHPIIDRGAEVCPALQKGGAQ